MPDDEVPASLWEWAREQEGLDGYNAAMVLVYDDPSSNIDWHFDKVKTGTDKVKTKLAEGSRVHSFSFAKHPADEGKLLAVMEFGNALGKNPNDKATFFRRRRTRQCRCTTARTSASIRTPPLRRASAAATRTAAASTASRRRWRAAGGST